MIVAHGNGTREVRRLGSARAAAGLRRDMPPVTAFKWAFGHLLAAAGLLEAIVGLARTACRHGARHRDTRHARSGVRPAERVARRARASQQGRAAAVTRLRRDQHRLSVARSVNVLPPAAPDGTTRCGVDTVDIARIERLLAETPDEDLRKLYSAAGARATPATARDARRLSLPASPPRKPAPSFFRAKWRSERSVPPTSR